MSGVTDLPFRQIALECGIGMVVSEMVASEELVKQRPDVVLRSQFPQAAAPRIMQLAGREAHWMAEGAKVAADHGADIIDINMGCPARKVTGALSGSALMQNSDHALRLIEATAEAVSIPVTVKMRLGWDHNSLNAAEIARRAEQAGIAAFYVHGRTRQQFYKGHADWKAVADTVQAVRVPVIVNGDIHSIQTARQALRESGAKAVMIGRAAEGRPWLLSQIAAELQNKEPVIFTAEDKSQLVVKHYKTAIEHYQRGHKLGPEMGRHLGVRMMRKHLASYVDHADLCLSAIEKRHLKSRLCQETCPHRVEEILSLIFVDEAKILSQYAA